MNLADEVMTALRSTPTIFVCNGGEAHHCGGVLWHVDGDEEGGRLSCERCHRYMRLAIAAVGDSGRLTWSGVPGTITFHEQLPLELDIDAINANYDAR